MPRSPKGRAVARGLDARLHLQHAFIHASRIRFTQNSSGQSKMPIDSNHGIYRDSGHAQATTSMLERTGC
jgi:hypothetical protein